MGMIQLALQYAPQAAKVYEEARALIQRLFLGGIIDAATQTMWMDWANAHEAAVLAGQKPPELVIDPDPV